MAKESIDIWVRLYDIASAGLKAIAKSLSLLASPAKIATKAFRALSSTIGLVSVALAGISIGYLVKSFMEAAATTENFRVRLLNLLGNAKEANTLFENMAEYAGKVSYQYKDIMESASSLSAVMTGGREEIEKWMPVVTDLAASFNLTMKDTTSGIIRMYTSGAAAADLFRERGIIAMLGFKAGVHYTAEETKKRIIEAWEEPASKFRGMTEALGKTWSGMISILQDKWFLLRSAIMQGGLFDYMKGALRTLLNYLDKIMADDSIEQWAADSSKAIIKGIEDIAHAIGFMIEAGRMFRKIWLGIEIGITDVKIAITTLSRVIARAMDSFAAYQELIYKGMAKLTGDQGPLRDVQEWRERNKTSIEKSIDDLKEYEQELVNIEKKLADLESAEPIANRIDAVLEEIKRQAQLLKDSAKETEEMLSRRPAAKPTKVGGTGKAQKYTEVDRIRDEMEKVDALTKSFLGRLDFEYDQQRVKLEEYFTARKVLAEQAYDYELEKLIEIEQAIPVSKRKDKEQALLDIYKRQKEYEQELLSIESARIAAVKEREDAEKEAAETIKSVQARAADIGGGLDVEIEAEARDLEQRHQEEIDRFLEMQKAGHISSEQLQDLHNAQMLEKEKLLADQRTRIREREMEASSIVGDAGYRERLARMDGLQAEHVEQMRNLTASQQEEMDRLLEIQKEGYATEEQVQKLHHTHMLENERLLTEQREQIQRQYIAGLGQTFGDLSQAFHDFYRAGGEESKEFFELYKVTAIAQTIISTYQSAQEAYKSLAGIPVVGPGLAVAAAAAAIAAGLGRVAVISAQTIPAPKKTSGARRMALGGLVETSYTSSQVLTSGGPIRGHSPSDHADNVPISATAGEFMHPVKAVRYYGMHAMEAIRRMTIPKEILEPYINPYVPIPVGRSLAIGGMVGENANTATSYSVTVPVTTIDTMDGLVDRLRDVIEDAVETIMDRELG